jgi:hypothetical protein
MPSVLPLKEELRLGRVLGLGRGLLVLLLLPRRLFLPLLVLPRVVSPPYDPLLRPAETSLPVVTVDPMTELLMVVC